jgi:ADP-heptose:LPS heptosyltransferase
LASFWHKQTGGDVFLIGDPSFWRIQNPYLLSTQKGSDWLSTASILLTSELFIGIDSGPMHLARAAAIPSFIIWGGSGPQDILGRSPNNFDIRANLPCIENLCAACIHGKPLCMQMIGPEIVWDKVLKYFFN